MGNEEKKFTNANWESGGRHRKGNSGDKRYRSFKRAAKAWFLRLLKKELKKEDCD